MSVIRGAGYILAHVPDMVLAYGTTQTTERALNPDGDYIRLVGGALRSYDDAVSYAPNQVYIGGAEPEELLDLEFPWYDKPRKESKRFAKFGEIMPQDELLLLIQACDVFEIVLLTDTFVMDTLPRFRENAILGDDILSRVGAGIPEDEVSSLISNSGAEALFHGGNVVGCIKRAHDIDVNLSAHVMLENIASKATSTLALLYGLRNSGVDKNEIEYVIDCSEEACGDMNQRGGGGLAKSVAEIAGLHNATGADMRAFCAGPAHAIVQAAALVDSGVYKAVAVTAGGSTAKLGMNGRDHVKKGLPILEDALGGFSVIITQNDGVSPEIDLGVVGRHTVGTGSSPQAVMTSLVSAPLERAGLRITDVDLFAPELQNPDITKPAGAGDVPQANYKMIGALAVTRGDLDKSKLADFIVEHGLPGFAPTQGHIPSGAPLIGIVRERIMDGKLKNTLFISKGSLFLGRMTSLFDGVSFLVKKNAAYSGIGIAVTGIGSELGEKAVADACSNAVSNGYSICYLGNETVHGAINIKCADETECEVQLSRLLQSGECVAAVTMHHAFPIGTATVGRVVTPSRGKEMFIATTTGTPSADRTESLVLGAIYGIITAKSCGVTNPTVGILNIDGAHRAETVLRKLREGGFPITLAESSRADGGAIMRGNDVLLGAPDVLVCDPLTGNVLIKMLSAFNSGGDRECSGYGYGPSVGKDAGHPILIVSRASDSQVIFNAIRYASEVYIGGIGKITADLLSLADNCGLKEQTVNMHKDAMRVHAEHEQSAPVEASAVPVNKPPERETVTEEIAGIEVTDIEDATHLLWQKGVYAESGMGCTGPVIMVNEKNLEQATAILRDARYIE